MIDFDWQSDYYRAWQQWRKHIQFAHDDPMSQDVWCYMVVWWQMQYETLMAGVKYEHSRKEKSK